MNAERPIETGIDRSDSKIAHAYQQGEVLKTSATEQIVTIQQFIVGHKLESKILEELDEKRKKIEQLHSEYMKSVDLLDVVDESKSRTYNKRVGSARKRLERLNNELSSLNDYARSIFNETDTKSAETIHVTKEDLGYGEQNQSEQQRNALQAFLQRDLRSKELEKLLSLGASSQQDPTVKKRIEEKQRMIAEYTQVIDEYVKVRNRESAGAKATDAGINKNLNKAHAQAEDQYYEHPDVRAREEEEALYRSANERFKEGKSKEDIRIALLEGSVGIEYLESFPVYKTVKNQQAKLKSLRKKNGWGEDPKIEAHLKRETSRMLRANIASLELEVKKYREALKLDNDEAELADAASGAVNQSEPLILSKEDRVDELPGEDKVRETNDVKNSKPTLVLNQEERINHEESDLEKSDNLAYPDNPDFSGLPDDFQNFVDEVDPTKKEEQLRDALNEHYLNKITSDATASEKEPVITLIKELAKLHHDKADEKIINDFRNKIIFKIDDINDAERNDEGKPVINFLTDADTASEASADRSKNSPESVQEHIRLKNAWVEARTDRIEAEAKEAWWKLRYKKKLAKFDEAEQAARNEYAQVLFGKLIGRETRENNNNPDQFNTEKYKTWFVQRFGLDNYRDNIARREQNLDSEKKGILNNLRERLSGVGRSAEKHKHKVKWSVRIGSVVLAGTVAGVATAATAGLAPAILTGVGVGAWRAGRIATTAGLAAGASGIAFEKSTKNVEQKYHHKDEVISKVSGAAARDSYIAMLNNMDQYVAEVVGAKRDVSRAERSRRRKTIAFGATTGLATAGVFGVYDALTETEYGDWHPYNKNLDSEAPANVEPTPNPRPDLAEGETQTDPYAVIRTEMEEVVSDQAKGNYVFSNPDQVPSREYPAVNGEGLQQPTQPEINNATGADAFKDRDLDGFQDRSPQSLAPNLEQPSGVDTTPTSLESDGLEGIDIEQALLVHTVRSGENFWDLMEGDCGVDGQPPVFREVAAEHKQALIDLLRDRVNADANLMEAAGISGPTAGDLDIGDELNLTVLDQAARAIAIEQGWLTETSQAAEVDRAAVEPALDSVETENETAAPSESVRPEARPEGIDADVDTAPVETPDRVVTLSDPVAIPEPEAGTSSAEFSGVTGNFEVLAGDSFGKVFGEGVTIPEVYKTYLQTELTAWSNERGVPTQAELSNHLEALMMRDQFIMQSMFPENYTVTVSDLEKLSPYGSADRTNLEYLANYSEESFAQFFSLMTSNLNLAQQELESNLGVTLDPFDPDRIQHESTGDVILNAIKSGRVTVQNGEVIFQAPNN